MARLVKIISQIADHKNLGVASEAHIGLHQNPATSIEFGRRLPRQYGS